MSDSDHPRPAPLARAALLVSLSGVILGFLFIPQVLALALAGLSLVREPHARRAAAIAAAVSLTLTIAWGIGLGALLKWWAASQV